MDLGQKIKYVREQRNMSQVELSERSGLSKGYISEIENGLKRPSVKSLEKLSVVLKADAGFFMDDTAVTFKELLDVSETKLPDEVMAFLADQVNLPYITLAKKLSEQKIPPETVEKIINTIFNEIKKHP